MEDRAMKATELFNYKKKILKLSNHLPEEYMKRQKDLMVL